MTGIRAAWLAVAITLAMAESAVAHHSLANHDTTTAVRVKGTVVQFHRVNPHSIIYLDEKGPAGQLIRRWAVEGPSAVQIQRQHLGTDAFTPGDVIEVCGYLPKESITWQIASPDPAAVSLAGRLITAELIVTADGHEQSWGDYGVHRCFAQGFRDQHSR